MTFPGRNLEREAVVDERAICAMRSRDRWGKDGGADWTEFERRVEGGEFMSSTRSLAPRSVVHGARDSRARAGHDAADARRPAIAVSVDERRYRGIEHDYGH